MFSPFPFRRLVFLLLGCVLGAAGCSRAPRESPEEAANSFFAAVAGGDFKKAYDNAAFGFQSAQTPEAFQANCEDLGLAGAQPPVWTHTAAGEKQSLLSGLITNQPGKALNLSVTLALDGGAWKVYALHTEASDADHAMGNPFTLVGKGSDFKDVYHQPLPAPAQISALAQETMVKFARALQERNFDPFYRYVAQAWRDGTVPSAQGAKSLTVERNDSLVPDARITVPLLESNFGAFIEKKVDLTPMSKTPPVLIKPPRIDDNGALDLEGYFTDGRLRAIFSFQYVYEIPKWRLSAMTIEVRE